MSKILALDDEPAILWEDEATFWTGGARGSWIKRRRS
jgi:hypothetical protein